MKKNLFLTFWFSFIPGAGQMYQNYMKRGLSIMCLAGILFILATLLETAIFLVPLLIVLAYSFFDTYNIRSSIGEEDQIKDEYILKGFNFEELKGNKILGIGIILIGVYLLLNNVIYGLASQLKIRLIIDLVLIIRDYFPSLIVSAITIGIGIKIISNNKK